jgi:GNAT superfamily N-acetyltransferase
MLRVETFDPSYTDEVVTLCEAEGWPSWTPERVGAALCAPGVIALVARDESGVLGVAELLTDGAVVGYLGLLLVSQDARRRGVGRALIGELFARSGLSRIDLLSEPDATDFYESVPHKVKLGYRIYPDA